MALQISLETPSGATADYWKIEEMNFSIRNNVNGMNIIVDGYVNEQARIDGYEPLQIRTVHMDGASSALEITNDGSLISGFYALLKTHPDWESAEDV